MDDSLASMQTELQDSLDIILSRRPSNELKSRAFRDIERRIATCMKEGQLQNFLALQYTFECNVPARLLPWIATATFALEAMASRGSLEDEKHTEAIALSSLLSLSLFLLQGIALLHTASKAYLGRQNSLEVLVDLLLASRHLPSITTESPTKAKAELPLSSVILDTLICVMVDSPAALRAFEECNGIQTVVKILKRAGTPREVRMKCLEFLYFYLMDETVSRAEQQIIMPMAESTPPPTVPSTPARTPAKKSFIAATPRRPMSRYGSSTYAFTSTSDASSSGSSSRSTSASSFSSTSSNASSSTSASSSPSTPSSPKKALQKALVTAPMTPVTKAQPRSLLMLKRDVDFIPSSPASVQVRNKGHARAKSELGPQHSTLSIKEEELAKELRKGRKVVRTIAEKKELLGTMLGNVDALVESVTKAGIWGLG